MTSDEQHRIDLFRQLGSVRAAARELEMHHTALLRWLNTRGIDTSANKGGGMPSSVRGSTGGTDPLGRPGVSVTNDSVTVTTLTRASGENVSPEDVLTEHGLDPTQWDVISYTSNRWHGPTQSGKQLLEQSKLTARRKPECLVTAATPRAPGWIPAPPMRTPKRATRLIAAIGDPHCPLDEKDFTEGTIAWLAEFQPDEILLLGDASDNSPWKRHKKNHRTDCSMQEALDSTYEYLARIRATCPNARISMIFGNHDYWVRDRLGETMPELLKLRRPGIDDGHAIISLEHWLRLDELRITVEETEGEYHDVVMQVLPDLVAMHGTATGPHGGAVKEFQAWEGASVLQGHDHKGSIVLLSKKLADGTRVQRVAVSAGTGASPDLGYDPKQNVNQSFATFTVHENNEWHPELAIFNPQTRSTTWRDWTYRAA